MNTIGIIVIALLLVALVVALCRWRDLSVQLREACHRATVARSDAELERKNAAAATAREGKATRHADLLGYELVKLRGRRGPARFVLEGGMTEEQIERALAGSSGSPIVRAITAHVGAKLVSTSDRATDAPRELVALPERVIEGYTAEMRLHDAGGASHLAELLAELQSLTAAKAEEEKPATAA